MQVTTTHTRELERLMLPGFLPLEIPGAKLFTAKRHGDPRGFFSETYNQDLFAEAGVHVRFVQDNHVYSAHRHTLRGLHFQIAPFEQAKLVRVVRGAILDVVVDVRVGSPMFGRHVALVISADEWNQIFVPVGCAHGVMTLEPHTEVIYKVSNFYSPAHDKGLAWNDPALGIDWAVEPERIVLSDKDRHQPQLGDLPEYFFFGSDE